MPTISTSTTIVVPAGQKMTVQGGNATVTVNPGSLAQIYTLTGGDTDTFGPFDRATSLHIQITSGSVTYNTISEDSTQALIDDGQIVSPDGDVVGGGVVERPAGATLDLDAQAAYAAMTVAGATTINTTGSKLGAAASITVVADGANVPTVAGAAEWANSFGYLNAAGVPNRLDVWHDGLGRRYAWSQAKTPAAVDTTAPVLSSASVAGASLVLAYNETLFGTAPAASAFSVVGAGGVTQAPSTVSIAGASVILTLATPAVSGNTVVLNYTPPSLNPISDLQFNAAVALTSRAVTNNTAALLVVSANSANWSSLGGGDYTNSGATNSYDARAVMTQTLAAGADGWIEAVSLNTTDSTVILGFDVAGAVANYDTYDFAVICSGVSGNLQYCANSGTGTTIGAVATPGASTKVRLARFGGTVTIDESTNGGATWTTRYTFAGSSTGALYAHASTYTGRKIYDLAGKGLA